MLRTFLPILVIMAVFLVAMWYMRRPDVSSSEARRVIASGGVLVDVRSPGEYAAGHIDGAVNLPVDQVTARPDRVGPKQRPVIVYCASGMRSAAAARALKAAGYQDVRNLGAMSNW